MPESRAVNKVFRARSYRAIAMVAQRDTGHCYDCDPHSPAHDPETWHACRIPELHDAQLPAEHPHNLVTLCLLHFQARRGILRSRGHYDPLERPYDPTLISFHISKTTHEQVKDQALAEQMTASKLYRRLIEASFKLYLKSSTQNPADKIDITWEELFPNRPQKRTTVTYTEPPRFVTAAAHPNEATKTFSAAPKPPPQLPITDAPILNSRDYYDALTQAQLEADDHRLQKERLIHYDRHNLIPNHPDDTQFLLDNPEFNLDKIRIDWVLAHMYDLPEPKWTVVDVDF